MNAETPTFITDQDGLALPIQSLEELLYQGTTSSSARLFHLHCCVDSVTVRCDQLY